MKNSMDIDGYQAVIQFDPDIDMFRGEFVGLNGGADFYAQDIAGLKREGLISLNAFLDMCREDGVEPRRQYSGKFNVRISPELHADVDACAAAAGKSLNQWVSDILSHRSMLNEMSKLLDELQCKDLLDQEPHLPPEVKGEGGIYVFYEDNNPLYVGRSDDIRTRIQIHSRPNSPATSANFAFILTRDDWNIWDGPCWSGPLPKAGSKEDIKRRIASKEGTNIKRLQLTQKSLLGDVAIRENFERQKKRIKAMQVKVIHLDDPPTQYKQAMFEVYAAKALDTRYNDFSNH